jgi:hypothetical protein
VNWVECEIDGEQLSQSLYIFANDKLQVINIVETIFFFRGGLDVQKR